MKKLLFICLPAFAFLACQNQDASTAVLETPIVEETIMIEEIENPVLINEVLSVADFKAKLENTEKVQLLDIRTPAELIENGSMDGAFNYDFYSEEFKSDIMNLNTEIPVMLYCRSGGRSAQAAALLKEWGFKEVYDLQGGYDAWLANKN